jgi:hypothetical protein
MKPPPHQSGIGHASPILSTTADQLPMFISGTITALGERFYYVMIASR